MVTDFKPIYDAEFHQDLSYWQVLDIHKNKEELKKCDKCKTIDKCVFKGRVGIQEHIEPYMYNGKWYLNKHFRPCKYFAQMVMEETREARWREAELPPEFEGVTFYDVVVNNGNRKAVEVCEKLLPVYLYGKPGVGKTMLLAAMANKAINQGISTLFITVPELISELRPTGEDPAGTMMRAKNIPLLMLDDYGAENTSPWVQEQLYMLINYRYGHRKSTCFSSNVSLTGVNARLASRIKAMCNVIFIDGQDMRI